MDHAEGPRPDRQQEQQQKSSRTSWFASRASQLGQSLLSLATKKAPETEQAQEKVNDLKVSFQCSFVCGGMDFMKNAYLHVVRGSNDACSNFEISETIILILWNPQKEMCHLNHDNYF